MTLLSALESVLRRETTVLEKEVQYQYPGVPTLNKKRFEEEKDPGLHTIVTFRVAPRRPISRLDETAVKELNSLAENLLRGAGIEWPVGLVRQVSFGELILKSLSPEDQGYRVNVEDWSAERGQLDPVPSYSVRTSMPVHSGRIRSAHIFEMEYPPDHGKEMENIVMMCPYVSLVEKVGELRLWGGRSYEVSAEFQQDMIRLFGSENKAQLTENRSDSSTFPLTCKIDVRIYPAIEYFKAARKLAIEDYDTWKENAADSLRIGSSYHVCNARSFEDIGRILVLPYNQFFSK